MRQHWTPGRHIAIIGPTEAGKSYVAKDLLDLRKYSILFTLKLEDKTLKRYKGYDTIRRWADKRSWHHHIIYHPKFENLRDIRKLQEECYGFLNSIFKSRGYALCFDDLRVVCDQLGLKQDVATMYVFVRSHGTSLVGLYQRPAFVVKEALSQCYFWLVFFVADDEDLVRIAHAAHVAPDTLRAMNSQLGDFDFMFLSRKFPPSIVRRSDTA